MRRPDPRRLLFGAMVVLLLAPYLELPVTWDLARFAELGHSLDVVRYLGVRRELDVVSLKPLTLVVTVIVLAVELSRAAYLMADGGRTVRPRTYPMTDAGAWLCAFLGLFLAWRVASYRMASFGTPAWRDEIWYDQFLALAAFLATVLHFRHAPPDRTLRLVVRVATSGAIAAVLQLAYGVREGYQAFLYRPGGLFADAVVLSLVLLAGLVLIDEGYAPARRRSWRWTRGALLVAGLLASGSGGVWLLGALDLLVLGPYRRRLRARTQAGRPSRRTLGAVMPALAAFAAIVVGSVLLYDSHLLDAMDPRRVANWRLASRLFVDNLWLGVGTGQYADYNVRLTETWREFGSNPHNIYLEVAAENGLAGLVAFLFPILATGALAVSRELREAGPGVGRLVVLLSLGAGYIGFLSSIPLEYLMILSLAAAARAQRHDRPSSGMCSAESGATIGGPSYLVPSTFGAPAMKSSIFSRFRFRSASASLTASPQKSGITRPSACTASARRRRSSAGA